MSGETEDAARLKTTNSVPKEVLAEWASEQAILIDKNRYEIEELLSAARRIHSLGGDPANLPYCLSGGKFISLQELRTLAKNRGRIYLLLSENYEGTLKTTQISEWTVATTQYKILDNLVCFELGSPDDLFSEKELSKKFIQGNGGLVDLESLGRARFMIESTMDLLNSVWEQPLWLKIERIQIFEVGFFRTPDPRWVLTIEPKP